MTTPDPEFAAILARARTRVPPASPAVVDEPAAADVWLSAQAQVRLTGRPTAPRPTPPPSPSAGRPSAGSNPAAPVPALALGVAGLLAAYAAGDLDPDQVRRAVVDDAGEDGPVPSAVWAVVSGSEASAQESVDRWRTGRPRPLEGVPFAVKDIIDVAGTPSTCGSWHVADRVPVTDARAVARLREAGAVPVLMTATTEFACGAPDTARSGPARNPWDDRRWTGGSSTGSAAVLAARVVPLALGTDTGGSIRVPSAFCGTTGLKPTYGLVPRTGVATLSWSLDHVGPMARSAADIALVLPHLVGPDGEDPSAQRPVELDLDALAGAGGLRGLRVGVVRGWFEQRCDAGVLGVRDRALGDLRAAGGVLVDVEITAARDAYEDSLIVLSAELAATQEANGGRRELYGPGILTRIDRGRSVGVTDYLQAMRRRAGLQREVSAVMDAAGVDVLLTPAVGSTAAVLQSSSVSVDGEDVQLQTVVPRYTSIVNHLGFPALVVPGGTAGDGLPVGLQLIGRAFGEAVLLAAAQAYQCITTHHELVPPRSTLAHAAALT